MAINIEGKIGQLTVRRTSSFIINVTAEPFFFLSKWIQPLDKIIRSNTTKEFSIAFYVKLKKIELSYRIHLKFNLSDTQISWKGYLIGSLTPKINIHLMAYKKKQTVRRCLPSKILLSLSI